MIKGFLKKGLVILFVIMTTFLCANDTEERIYIGLSYPAFLDDEIKFIQGFDLALETINKSGGIKGKILEVVYMDDKGTVADGMKAAHTFIHDETIMTVIGHFNSRVAVVTSKIYNDAQMPFIAPCTTTPYLMKEEYLSVFRTIPDDKRVMAYTLDFLKDEGYERLAVYYAADDFGKGVVDSVEDYSERIGLEVVDRTTAINSANIERVMARWDALDAEILIIGETYEWAKDIIKEVKRRNRDILIVGTSSLDYPEYTTYLDDYAEGTIVPTHYRLNKTSKENKLFVEAFSKKYDMKPDMYSAIAYDTLMIFAEAAESTSELTKGQIARQLSLIKNKNCITGTLSCENGEFIGDNIFLKTVINGEFLFVDSIHYSDTK